MLCGGIVWKLFMTVVGKRRGPFAVTVSCNCISLCLALEMCLPLQKEASPPLFALLKLPSEGHLCKSICEWSISQLGWLYKNLRGWWLGGFQELQLLVLLFCGDSLSCYSQCRVSNQTGHLAYLLHTRAVTHSGLIVDVKWEYITISCCL